MRLRPGAVRPYPGVIAVARATLAAEEHELSRRRVVRHGGEISSRRTGRWMQLHPPGRPPQPGVGRPWGIVLAAEQDHALVRGVVREAFPKTRARACGLRQMRPTPAGANCRACGGRAEKSRDDGGNESAARRR